MNEIYENIFSTKTQIIPTEAHLPLPFIQCPYPEENIQSISFYEIWL